MNGQDQRVADVYADPADFEALLDDASANARSDRAREFCDDMTARFEKYGERMYVTDKQLSWLKELADGEKR